MNLSLDNIRNAYLRLKKSIYYDNNHFLKRQIFDYESNGNLEHKLKLLFVKINNEDESYFKSLQVSYYTLPKSVNKNHKEEKSNSADDIIKNFNSDAVNVSSVINSINISIDYHIVCVLWILKIGYKLVKDLKHNYGNILIKEELLKLDSCNSLFEIYWGNYRSWRDRAIKAATTLHKNERDSIIVALDIKEFYASVKINQVELLNQLGKNDFLTRLLIDLCVRYTKLHQSNIDDEVFCLPIGLLSSPVIANWYLSKLDDKIIETGQTYYYGRYVDDILCVFNHHNAKSITSVEDIIKLYFKDVLEIDTQDKTQQQYRIKVENREELFIQHEKLKVMLFHHLAPLSLLENFADEIRKSSSEFRLFPNKYSIENDFNYASTKIIYNGSINKLRSIKEFINDSFATSVFLSKSIYMAIKCGISDQSISHDIICFFDQENIIKHYLLWEKIFIYFIAVGDIGSLLKINEKIIYSISSLVDENSIKINVEKIKNDLNNYKNFVLEYVLSLSPDNKKFSEICELDISKKIQLSKMLNHKYYKLQCLQFARHENIINLLDIKIDDFKSNKINSNTRTITTNELNTLEFLDNISRFGSENYLYKISKFPNFIKSTKDKLLQINVPNNNDNTLTSIKIGIANMVISSNIFKQQHFREIKHKAFLTDKGHMEKVIDIMNSAVHNKVQLLLLPECAIPLGSLDVVIDKARKEQIAMVFGLQHIINSRDFVFNVQVTILPFIKNGIKDAYVDYRLKKHYSPSEERLLVGFDFNIPKDDQFSQHKLFVWKNLWFSSLNCFEFANIDLRGCFRSCVDLLAISEYNKDVNYYSNIVESAARDIHCYIAQANTSDFGDSRVCSPSATEQKDIIRAKGGINSIVIVDELNILALRDFQRLNYELQKDNKLFKPTPPEFNKKHQRII